MLYIGVVLFGYTFTIVKSTESGCTVDNGKTVALGEKYDFPGSCGLNICNGGDQWSQIACGLVAAPAGWDLVPEDPSKGYPECCGRAVPPCRVVPDVVDHMGSYSTLEILYDEFTVEPCVELTPSQTQNQPEVSYTGDPRPWSLLAVVDPDAPADHEGLQYLHWMVVNIPDGRVAAGDALAGYAGPSPPKGTGLHRYVFLMYNQHRKLSFDEPRITADSQAHRASFSIRDFAKKYRLGDPVAANVFKAQHEE